MKHLLASLLVVATLSAAQARQTFTGTITDDICASGGHAHMQMGPTDAEQARVSSEGAAFLGIRVVTMNSDGNLYLLQHAVAKLVIDKRGRIQNAEPAIHRSLSGFVDVDGAPPGDIEQSNKKTPFVWADAHGS
ncbi:MAG: hypothetical protein A3G76_15515 [Acidobacteria bacterium RIFCSPLOWO2_12_FULL_65_11]|nr:MAG: hypothetical protein A3H95_17510 [Acidobacteria bacterium RIFCSPLOWO2_02_FULL_64_15]OFW30678.1 MAG: hypothetical protein A3G76_15515 [Acidobacteria bacterium RIFCSPLOWO2_12_FULL_65_11]